MGSRNGRGGLVCRLAGLRFRFFVCFSRRMPSHRHSEWASKRGISQPASQPLSLAPSSHPLVVNIQLHTGHGSY